MTLIELTVVILVLLSLIALLFVGTRAWKKGSDRAANIVNIRNAQQAVRSHQNIRVLKVGAPLAEDVVYGTVVPGTDGYLTKPVPPSEVIVSYQGSGTVPEIGELWLEVAYRGTAEIEYGPGSIDTSTW